MNLTSLCRLSARSSPFYRFNNIRLRPQYNFSWFGKKPETPPQKKSFLSRFFSGKQYKLPLTTRIKNKFIPRFLRREVVMPDGSIVIRPPLTKRMSEFASKHKIQDRAIDILKKPFKKGLNRILTWLAIAVLIYSIGAQIPRELRIYLEKKSERPETPRRAETPRQAEAPRQS